MSVELPSLTDIEITYNTLKVLARADAFRARFGFDDEVWTGLVEGRRCLNISMRQLYGAVGEALFERLEITEA